ncbi:MAG: metalloregulator ArsR/SmtB family transcription factor [Anaerolineae bacterium]
MEHSYAYLADLFKALSHSTRLQILDLLRDGELCVCHIEAALDKRQAYVSQQLMALREAGLVVSRRHGLQVYYRLADTQIDDLLDAAFGNSRTGAFQRIDGCPCPSCTTIPIEQIH